MERTSGRPTSATTSCALLTAFRAITSRLPPKITRLTSPSSLRLRTHPSQHLLNVLSSVTSWMMRRRLYQGRASLLPKSVQIWKTRPSCKSQLNKNRASMRSSDRSVAPRSRRINNSNRTAANSQFNAKIIQKKISPQSHKNNIIKGAHYQKTTWVTRKAPWQHLTANKMNRLLINHKPQGQ